MVLGTLHENGKTLKLSVFINYVLVSSKINFKCCTSFSWFPLSCFVLGSNGSKLQIYRVNLTSFSILSLSSSFSSLSFLGFYRHKHVMFM